MTEIFKVKIGIATELMKGVISKINLNVTVAYHVLKGMTLKHHLPQVQKYGTKFPQK